MAREQIAFRSGDADCAAWLYRQQAEGGGACVVLGHGFGALKEGRLYPAGFDWRNRYAARAGLRVATYSPGRRAADLNAALLVQVADDDQVTPAEPARRVAARAPRGELREYPGGHFDIYVGAGFERAVADQLAFLETHL